MGTTWVAVTVHGKVKVTAWGPLTIGAKIKAHAQSTVAAWVSGSDAANAAFGTATQTAACGDTILVIVECAAL
jgi:hypothetical protein